MKQRARYRRNKYHYVDPKQAEIEASGCLVLNMLNKRKFPPELDILNE